MIAGRIAAGLAGSALIVWTLLSAIKTVILPRAATTTLTRAVFVPLRRVFDAVASESRSFEFRDRVMALYAPLGMLLLPLVWSVMLVLGFTALFWATGIDPLAESFAVAGSSMFTLGFERPDGTFRVALAFLGALLGLGIVALVISYLPTIYQAFSRREALVGLLEVRAGLPPSPVELLTRYQRIGLLSGIHEDLFPEWERWFAELEESHTSHPVLGFFRSPQPGRSWITAAGCILDTAAILNSTVDCRHDAQADLLLRSGFFALRRIADYFDIGYDPDPAPTDPISVTRQEFDEMRAELGRQGVPVKPDADQAWRDFAGWRVNYDEVLIQLAALVMAPPAHWSSDRTAGSRPRPKVMHRHRAGTSRGRSATAAGPSGTTSGAATASSDRPPTAPGRTTPPPP